MQNWNIALRPSAHIRDAAIGYSQILRHQSKYQLTNIPHTCMDLTESIVHMTLLQFQSTEEVARRLFHQAETYAERSPLLIITQLLDFVEINKGVNAFWLVKKTEEIAQLHENILSRAIDTEINMIYGDYGSAYNPHFTLSRHKPDSRSSQEDKVKQKIRSKASMQDRHLTLILGSVGPDGQLQEVYENRILS